MRRSTHPGNAVGILGWTINMTQRRDLVTGLRLAWLLGVWLIPTGLGAGGLAFAQAAVADDRPNVIFILADDLGWHDVGCFGSTHGRSNSAAVRFPCTARGTPAAT